MKDKVAIFDMDGTLFDTRNANYEAYKYSIEKAGYKCVLTDVEFNHSCYGRNYKEFLKEVFKIPEKYHEKIHDIKMNVYIDFVQKHVNEYKQMFELMLSIKGDYNIALLTTASKKNTYELLDIYNRRALFDYIVTAEDVKKLKPDQEGMIKILEYFHTTADKAIFFDDSKACVEAASKMGIIAFQIRT